MSRVCSLTRTPATMVECARLSRQNRKKMQNKASSRDGYIVTREPFHHNKVFTGWLPEHVPMIPAALKKDFARQVIS